MISASLNTLFQLMVLNRFLEECCYFYKTYIIYTNNAGQETTICEDDSLFLFLLSLCFAQLPCAAVVMECTSHALIHDNCAIIYDCFLIKILYMKMFSIPPGNCSQISDRSQCKLPRAYLNVEWPISELTMAERKATNCVRDRDERTQLQKLEQFQLLSPSMYSPTAATHHCLPLSRATQ